MTTLVERDLSQPMRQLIRIGNHLLTSDVSGGQGGRDAGPSPHDLYDAALGACISLTLLWYAKRRNIAVGPVKVSIERDASGERQGIYRLNAVLDLGGNLNGEERAELLAAAGHCPVHKLMTDVRTEIATTLIGSDANLENLAPMAAIDAKVLNHGI
ncbi:OsmC family protein [Pseudoduganella sp. LjRoot289]|uniref:OsmC family protein n=1 Tax=Pseudoduganella sp. LjRoot289 TaxID=3342314 RepID=UPI003F4F9B13